MPRDKKAEKAAEKKREELERKQEQERDRQREEERHRQALDEEREFEQQEERRRQQAEAARLKAVERHRQERRALEKTQQQRQQREAAHLESRQQEQRRATAEQGRTGERQVERDRERRDAQRQDAGREQQASDRAESRRQEQHQAQAGEQRQEDQQRARGEQRAEERRTERQSAQQTEAKAAQRSDERQAETRAAQRSEELGAQRSQERQDETRAAQRSEERAAQRSEDRQAETQAAQREEDRAARRSDERRQAQIADNQAARGQEQAHADEAKARVADQRQQQQMEDRASRKQEQIQADQAKARAERETPTAQRLQARLPSGRLSNGLPWLITSGNRIVSAEDATSPPQAVILRGVNRSGLEYSEPSLDFLGSAGITQADVAEMVSWGVNIVRVPFNQDWALHGRRGHPATEYLDNLDQLIFWLSGLGAYTLLDLQWLDADTPYGTTPDGPNRVAPLPNRDSIMVWTLLATRYQNEPAVLYDIFNEPHTPLADDHSLLVTIREDGTTVPVSTVTMAEWQPWARQLVAAIRKANLNSLIFVSGVDWGYDLRGMPLTIVAGGRDVFASLVYSTHVYPWKGPKIPTGALPADIPTLSGTAITPNWADAFGRLAATVPVFAGEWGGNDADASPWGEGLAMYMSALGVGWTAWSWVDWPYLRKGSLPSGGSMPTRFGNVVRHWLAMP